MYTIIQLTCLLLLAMATLYILIFSIAGLFYREKKNRPALMQRRIAVLIPAYREDAVIVETAAAALQQNYPLSMFDVIIIADSLQPNTIERIRKMPVRLIEVSFEKSTKSLALNKAMSLLPNEYDIAIILDADNIMETGFLDKINTAFEAGHTIIQAHRTAKNTNTSWAILDAVSEEINNHIFRKGHRVLGLSSAIIGSGMAFDYSFFKTLMLDVTAVGGFDKEIELKMLKQQHSISYLSDAWVYDEKIQQPTVFHNQRRRWLSAQVHYFRISFTDALKELFKNRNLDYFDKSIQFLQPPRILLTAAVAFTSLVFISVNLLLQINRELNMAWIVLVAACLLALMLAVPHRYYNRKTCRALLNLPTGTLLMLLSLLKTKGANKTFIHTLHGTDKQS